VAYCECVQLSLDILRGRRKLVATIDQRRAPALAWRLLRE
jgi:hypothetical protein